ncbi:MAG: hypothetical protein Ct9H300mP23_01430 [Nitrospinota bacterium]|nr:MAG: hypothetical protein Ct9H300mP23_01430 [Nitrospinota bacterium]
MYLGARVRDELVQRYVTMQLAARRGGNAATKQNKGELHGSNAKPWRQKGTGRARSGKHAITDLARGV